MPHHLLEDEVHEEARAAHVSSSHQPSRRPPASKAGLSWKSFNSTEELLRDTSLWTDPKSWRTLKTVLDPDRPILQVLLENIRSALVIAMVSVPLAIGFGIASGAHPVAGLRTAIWGGMICGAFGSSPFNVVGPASALAGMLSNYSAEWGEDIIPWIAMFSGCICFAVFYLDLQRYCLLMPRSVFEGFTLAVARMIGLKQINFAFGLTGLPEHEEFVDNVWESLINLDKAQWGSMVLFFPETIALFVLPRLFPTVPWMITIPLASIVIGYFAAADASVWNLPTLKTEFGALPNVVAVLPNPDALVQCDDFGGLFLASAAVALVAVLQTLISAKVAEQRAPHNHRGPFNDGQEIAALSLAQVVCGLTGALPPTGLSVLTSISQLNGATHPVSQVMNAVLVLIITSAVLPLFSFLPLPSVAAVLFISAVRMVPVPFLKQLWTHDRTHLFLCISTAAVCVLHGLVEGLMYGTLLGYLIDAHRSSNAGPAVAVRNARIAGSTKTCRTVVISGPITFANAEAIVAAGIVCNRGAPGTLAGATGPLAGHGAGHGWGGDASAVLLGRKIEAGFGGGGFEEGILQVMVLGVPLDILRLLRSSPWFLTAQEAGRVFETSEEALLAHARQEGERERESGTCLSRAPSLSLSPLGRADTSRGRLEEGSCWEVAVGMDHPADVTVDSLTREVSVQRLLPASPGMLV
eukprot:CAMPEP_0180279314 /NCGR_PEP_ID=MMETSP0988-20121125/7992_1 /TAXON_ID=697907 /ORGANISM="non described non described, Strain CCMP2293" /LENGTH=693 /DNA_ID=CAMNT_0022251003 /DNA_START=91 /DNA_END=2173 /DNA_ORIENTATION=-